MLTIAAGLAWYTISMNAALTTITDPNLAEAERARADGNTIAARSAYRRVLERDPENIAALLGLALLAPLLADRRAQLARVIARDPANQTARDALSQVAAWQADGLTLAPRPKPAVVELPAAAAPAAETLARCYRHPDRETGLRCVQCDRPICAACARPAAVGQLCPECAEARRPPNYKVGAGHVAAAFALALIIALPISFGVGLFLGRIPFFGFIIAIAAGPASGELIVRAIEKLVRAKRGRPIQIAVGFGMVLGALPLLLFTGLFSLGTLIWGLWLFTAISTAVARLR